jgi:hypothetical protein
LQESIFFFNSTVIKNKKSSFPQKNKTYSTDKQRYMDKEKQALGGNSTYPKGGVSCSKDSFVVNQTLVFQIKFCAPKSASSQSRKTLQASVGRQCKPSTFVL